MTPRYFQKIATIWLRLVGVLMMLYGAFDFVTGLIYWAGDHAEDAHRLFIAVIYYGGAGLVLLAVSVPLGRLLASGLDDEPSVPPPA